MVRSHTRCVVRRAWAGNVNEVNASQDGDVALGGARAEDGLVAPYGRGLREADIKARIKSRASSAGRFP
jgi:hypothetical protein